MDDSRTSLVNTRIALADPPEAARNLYRRLVDLGAVEAQPHAFGDFSEDYAAVSCHI